ncbi:MAG: hypothetical protein M1819_001094 [Sarea resinae]|nr:MAG: hypothetical protein M1819_001094 [Sarea resinae]
MAAEGRPADGGIPLPSDASSSSSSASGPAISLHVLSPSTTEVPHLLSFTISPTTTVLELKHMIQNAVPSKPALDRQRLIHRGHLLAKDTDSMSDVFGQEALNDPSPKNLHLVLRPTPSEPVSFNRPLENPSLRPVLPVPRMSSRSSSRTSSPSGARDPEERRPQVDPNPHLYQPNHRLYNNATHILPPSALAPQFQSLLNNPAAAALAQNHGQGPAHAQIQQLPRLPGQPLPSYGTANIPPPHPGANPPPQPTFQQLVAQQQQARAASGLHGVLTGDEAHRGTDPNNASQQAQQPPRSQSTTPNPLMQPRTNTTVREGLGPNGERWNITINETTAAIPNLLAGLGQAGQPGQLNNNPIPGLETIFGGLAGLPNRPPTARHVPQQHGAPHQHGPPHQHGAPIHQGSFLGPQAQPQVPNIWSQQRSPSPLQGINQTESQRLSEMVLTLHHRLTRLENSLARGDAPSELDITNVRSQQASFPNQLNMLEAVFNRRIVDLAARSEQVRNTRRINREMLAASQRDSSPSSQPMRQSISAPPSEAPSEPTSTSVYLLASPTGPQALLFSPSGTFASPPQYGAPNLQFAHQHLNIMEDPRIVQQRALLQMQAQLREQLQSRQQPQQPAHPPADAPQVQQQAQLQHPQHHDHQQQQPPPNGPNALARLFMPLGGPLWLIFRVFGIAYFFIGNGGWRRTILVLISAFIFFLHQVGIFTSLQHAIWDPIRRHLDGLLPPPDNVARPPMAAGGAAAAAPVRGNEADAQPAAANAEPQAEPDPQAAAERLIRERQERDRGAVQGFGRRIERALFLFLASLVPGIGERHVAAQEEADAVRLVAQMQARELEQRGRETEESENAVVEGENAPMENEGVGEGEARGSENAAVENEGVGEGEVGNGSRGSSPVDALPAEQYHQHHQRSSSNSRHDGPGSTQDEQQRQQSRVAPAAAEERLIDV